MRSSAHWFRSRRIHWSCSSQFLAESSSASSISTKVEGNLVVIAKAQGVHSGFHQVHIDRRAVGVPRDSFLCVDLTPVAMLALGMFVAAVGISGFSDVADDGEGNLVSLIRCSRSSCFFSLAPGARILSRHLIL